MNHLTPQPRYRTYTNATHYVSLLRDSLAGRSTRGDACERLANEVVRRFDAKHAACMPQARMGIYYAIKQLVKPGQKVVLSPYTIADVINMVICAGARPVFCDIERETCNIDAHQIASAIDEQTGAVMITHLHGLACDIDTVVEICKQRNVPLIEDAAQAFGTKYHGKRCGTFGAAGIYSFGLYKNLTAIFGGMLVAPVAETIDPVARDLEKRPYFETSRLWKKAASALATDMATSPGIFQAAVFPVFRYGHLNTIRAINRFVETELDLSRKDALPESYFRRMTSTQAELALARIDRVDADTQVRIASAQRYHDALGDIPELILPPLRDDGSHIYTYYPVQGPDREALLRHLMTHKRDVGRQHLKNTADLPGFKEFYRECPNARATADTCILLPTYPRYTPREIDRTTQVIREFFGR